MSDDDPSAGELVTAAEEGALEVVADDAARRLAVVCAGWPADRFRELVAHVAAVRLHYGIPRVEYDALLRAWMARRAAERRRTPDDVVMPPPVELPPQARGFPAVRDRPASAPT